MGLIRDDIENSTAYAEAMAIIQPILDREFGGSYHMGMCHGLWQRKKELLKEMGIDWKTPAETNPDVIFD